MYGVDRKAIRRDFDIIGEELPVIVKRDMTEADLCQCRHKESFDKEVLLLYNQFNQSLLFTDSAYGGS